MNDSHTWARHYRKIFLFLLRFKWCRQKWICISVYLFTASFVYKNTRATYISTRKSTKKINAVHERSLRIIRNDYESLYPLLLEEAQQITLHQRCISYLMIKVYKYLNGHSPDIMNDIFKLRENTCNLRNFHIFQTENPRSLEYGLDAILYRASQLWQQVPTDTREAASLTLL